MNRMKRWTLPSKGLWCLWVSLVLLATACNTNAEPTFSPEDAATRLAQIPTAAVLNPTGIAATTAPPQALSPTNVPEPAPGPTELAPPTPLSIAGNLGEYTVQAGDTLSTIAFKFNISMAAIQIANNLGESQVVKIGQTLKVPQSKSFPDENVLWVLVEVKPGETLGGICQRYGVKLDDAVRVNNLRNASDIRAGQELIMPVNAPAAFVEAEPIAQAIPNEAAAPPPPTPLPPTLAPPTPSNSESPAPPSSKSSPSSRSSRWLRRLQSPKRCQSQWWRR
ncbi:MAG: LysM peptidoglycan-binding domain-containing protein [Anaerolineae bacterium]|nr:LysM peptidoglycan-binding domain-containing protein [Anaerolineae bacterium]